MGETMSFYEYIVSLIGKIFELMKNVKIPSGVDNGVITSFSIFGYLIWLLILSLLIGFIKLLFKSNIPQRLNFRSSRSRD